MYIDFRRLKWEWEEEENDWEITDFNGIGSEERNKISGWGSSNVVGLIDRIIQIPSSKIFINIWSAKIAFY